MKANCDLSEKALEDAIDEIKKYQAEEGSTIKPRMMVILRH